MRRSSATGPGRQGSSRRGAHSGRPSRQLPGRRALSRAQRGQPWSAARPTAGTRSSAPLAEMEGCEREVLEKLALCWRRPPAANGSRLTRSSCQRGAASSLCLGLRLVAGGMGRRAISCGCWLAAVRGQRGCALPASRRTTFGGRASLPLRLSAPSLTSLAGLPGAGEDAIDGVEPMLRLAGSPPASRLPPRG